jgi:hypothetical protein
LAVIQHDPTDTHLFCASTDHQLVTRRRNGRAAWTDPTVIGMASRLHPFSNMTTTQTSHFISVFFLDQAGLLSSTTPFLDSSNTYPAQNVTTLEQRSMPAYGFDVNPFGDVFLGENGEGTLLGFRHQSLKLAMPNSCPSLNSRLVISSRLGARDSGCE